MAASEPDSSPRPLWRRWLPWLIGAGVLVVLVAVVAPFVYIHLIESKPPKKFALDAQSASLCPSGEAPQGGSGAQSPQASLAGTWKASSCSEVRYRVKEVLFGQSTTAVGSTNAVTGSAVIDGTTVKSASFTADLTQVHSDRSQRDGQFRGRIMDVARFPTATFELATPIDLGGAPANGSVKQYRTTGRFTAHGVTREVTVTLETRRAGNQIGIVGSIPIVFADYDIPNPSFGPATTEDHGLVEFQLVLVPAP